MQATTEDRLIYGLIIAGIAAWCYPTAASLAEPGLRQIRAGDVERKLRDICERMGTDATTNGDSPDVAAGELSHVWAAYLARKSVSTGRTGGLRHDCTLYMVGRALRWLAEQQFLLRDPTNPELFRATDRFQHHVSAAASHAAYQIIAEACKADPGTATDRPADTGDRPHADRGRQD